MKTLIVGLGNKGTKYENTRHNVGFILIDELTKDLIWKEENKFKALVATEKSTLFIKPLTYMNNSGLSVKKAVDFYGIANDNIYVIHDDVDLPLGQARWHFARGSAGHRGVDSIISNLGTNEFWRIRVGIGRPEDNRFEIQDWVLNKLTQKELDDIAQVSKEIKTKIPEAFSYSPPTL